MTGRNGAGTVLIVISYALLVPGLFLPMFSLDIDTVVLAKIARIQADVVSSSRSIVGTAQDLYERDRYLVSFLIFFFSVIVPIAKGLMLLGAVLVHHRGIRYWLHKAVNVIGKWSMADVYVVALFLTYLSTADHHQTSEKTVEFMGMEIPVDVLVMMDSELGPGFYYFLGYCLTTLLAQTLIHIPLGEREV